MYKMLKLLVIVQYMCLFCSVFIKCVLLGNKNGFVYAILELERPGRHAIKSGHYQS